jgi:exonuclease III
VELCAGLWDAQDTQKPDFLDELVRMCEHQNLPMMVGGDFNIIRQKEEKNNDNFNARGLLFLIQ